MSAVEVRDRLAELEMERALALRTGIAQLDADSIDLDEEIEVLRRLFVRSPVTQPDGFPVPPDLCLQRPIPI